MTGVLIFWVLCGIVSSAIGASKGSPGVGFALGFLFGPFGIILVLFIKGDRRQCPYCHEYIDPTALKCPKCQTDLNSGSYLHQSGEFFSIDNETKKCPACAEIIKFEAVKCRYCGNDFDPEMVKTQIQGKKDYFLKKYDPDRLVSQEGKSGEAFCVVCRKVDKRSIMLHKKSNDTFYHPECLPKVVQEESVNLNLTSKEDRQKSEETASSLLSDNRAPANKQDFSDIDECKQQSDQNIESGQSSNGNNVSNSVSAFSTIKVPLAVIATLAVFVILVAIIVYHASGNAALDEAYRDTDNAENEVKETERFAEKAREKEIERNQQILIELERKGVIENTSNDSTSSFTQTETSQISGKEKPFKNTSSALKRLKQEKDSADAEEFFNLGRQYYRGIGVPIDEDRGIHYFKKAARLGNAEAVGFLRALGITMM